MRLTPSGESGVSFKLLKRGNKGKMEVQEVVVPASTSLAAQVNRNEEASREESSIIKARVRARTAVTHDTAAIDEYSSQFFAKVLRVARSCFGHH